MSRFYLYLWFSWIIRVTIESTLLASVFSLFITYGIYFNEGSATLNSEVYKALLSVFKFWFFIVWNLTLLIALFRSTKYLFNHSYNGYKLTLMTCVKDSHPQIIEAIGYGDLVKFWRKWFMLLIWLVATEMILALVLTWTVSSYEGLFEWFNSYILYAFILIAGYFSLVLVGNRCKQVKVKKC